eukprot:7826085-Pyramimonas_sp.AAC.1
MYLYLGEWNSRLWGIAEVHYPVYLTACEGLAHVLLVGGTCTLTRAKVETNMPRKRGAAQAGYDKAINKFYENCFQAIIKH